VGIRGGNMRYKKGYNRLLAGDLYSWGSFDNVISEEASQNQKIAEM
jgi:hypothetical protein